MLTSRTATILDMKQAVAGAESLLDEVKRELARRVLNEKRAAMEVLYEGIAKGEDATLSAALDRARTAEVGPEDIEKGEKKLEEVRSMTDEQRQAKVAHELEVERKKRAFMLVKRDNATELKEFIGSLGPDIRWQDWRDYAGRNLWKCSQELGANAVRQWLREELGLGVEQSKPRRGSRPSRSSTDFSQAEEKALQFSAQGAVVRDDADALQAVLDKVEVDMWSNWKNKAGKDLLTLSQERGSPMSYSVLAKALGLVTEAKRDTFEERETVWVFFPGEVQPMRATVLEDTPEEAEEIHVELWEGDPGSKMVKRCLVRKMGS